MSIRTQRSSTRIGFAAIAVALLASVFAFASPAGAVAVVETDRVSGADRYATAAAIATEAFPAGDLDNILLASGENFPDALAGNGLAGAVGAPILLTTAGELSDAAATAIEELAAADATVYILGGSNAVADSVDAEVEALGIAVERLAGADRYATAAAIAEFVDANATIPGINGTKTVIVATGGNFPDALAGGPVAYAGPHPVLLTETAALPASTAAAITAIGADEVVILGGLNAVSAEVETELETLTGNDAVRVRVEGGNRYSTAAAVADLTMDKFGFDGTEVLLASGTNFPDALAGGPLGGSTEAPIILTGSLPAESAAWLTANAQTIQSITALGGTAAIDAATLAAAEAAAEKLATITVTPAEATVLTVAATEPSAADNRTYTVTGLAAGNYTVALFPAAAVRTSATGVVTFADTTGTAGKADDIGNVSADIEVVNGAALADDTQITTVAPVNGQITFTVDGEVFESIRPVVFVDANTDGQLDLNADDLPSERYGLGGATTFMPNEANIGSPADAASVLFVNKDADFLVATDDSGVTSETYQWDANDLYYMGSISPATQVTQAAFEAELSVGDALDDTTVYQQNEAFVSTFVLNDITPLAPTPASPATVGETTVTANLSGVSPGATVTLKVVADSAVACTAPAVATATATADENATAANYQITASGLTDSTEYEYCVMQTVGGEASTFAGPTTVATTVPAAPTLTEATANDINDGVGTTNQVRFNFDEAVTVLDATDFTVSPQGQAFTLTGTSATLLAGGTTVVVTLDGTLNDAANTTDLTYDAIAGAGAVEDAGGLDNAATTVTFGY